MKRFLSILVCILFYGCCSSLSDPYECYVHKYEPFDSHDDNYQSTEMPCEWNEEAGEWTGCNQEKSALYNINDSRTIINNNNEYLQLYKLELFGNSFLLYNI